MRSSLCRATATIAVGLTAVAASMSYAAAAPHEESPPPVMSQLPSESDWLIRELAATRDAARTTPRSQSAPADPSAALQASLDQIVADGAVGTTARVDSPALTWSGAAGLRERGKPQEASKYDTFRAASITKVMVATLVIQEVERGTWTLQTPANEVIPNLFPGRDSITIDQLLSHRSGAPEPLMTVLASRITGPTMADFFKASSQAYTDQEIIDATNQLPWLPPEQTWSYSNGAYVALGMMLERATGTPLSELLEERIFTPARMVDSSYPRTQGMPRKSIVGNAFYAPEGWFSNRGTDPSIFSAAGAVVASTRDLNNFTEALVTGKLLKPETVNNMLTVRTEEIGESQNVETGVGYGLGVMRLPDPCSPPEKQTYLYGHNGAAFGTMSWSLASQDGSRQFSIGTSGRYYSESGEQPYNLDAAVLQMAAATC